MKSTDKAPRRLSFTQYLSPSHRHDQIVRKRAQSLNAQAERKNSILRNGTDDVGALSASEPLPASSSTLQSSSTSSRRRPKPRPYHERQVQFVDQGRPVHKPGHVSFASRRSRGHASEYVATYNRRRGRVSRATGQLYYVEELVPIYPYRSTCFSPPPIPLGRYDDESDLETPNGCFHLPSRRRATSSVDSNHEDREHDQGDNSTQPSRSFPDSAQPRPVDPLYTTLSEKLTAHWGVFALKVRFSMFRAQDRVKNGVARVGGIVRRMKTGA